jgi:aminoglycoside/choline kinase family phosphotransferase
LGRAILSFTLFEESSLAVRHPPAGLLPWAQATLGGVKVSELASVAGDASARRYFRLHFEGQTYIAVEAPPTSEKNTEFLAVRGMLERAGITVPRLYGADLENGFMLLGDLGDRLLLDELTPDTVDASYQRAFDILLTLGAIEPDDPRWPSYDDALFSEELSRFPQWFVNALLACDLPPEPVWRPFADLLKRNALEQPRVLVHRDFHSRNLMPQADGSLAVIDFQDSVMGPVSYDLVSLLRDCYIRWTPAQVEQWALEYLSLMQSKGQLVDVAAGQFLCWFDLMGLERHIKVLGTFARLYLRDRKSGYLQDLPLVLLYVQEMLEKYRTELPEVAAFADWFETSLMPVIDTQPWAKPS